MQRLIYPPMIVFGVGISVMHIWHSSNILQFGALPHTQHSYVETAKWDFAA